MYMDELTHKAINLAAQYYSKKKLAHGLRVADYVYQDEVVRSLGPTNRDRAYIVGLLHDIVEDTECTQDMIDEIFPEEIASAVKVITKHKEIDYNDYIQDILNSEYRLAYYVKKADLKDHLTLKETLTDKLKEKYIQVVGYFL